MIPGVDPAAERAIEEDVGVRRPGRDEDEHEHERAQRRRRCSRQPFRGDQVVPCLPVRGMRLDPTTMCQPGEMRKEL
jgi:hypothetical protein